MVVGHAEVCDLTLVQVLNHAPMLVLTRIPDQCRQHLMLLLLVVLHDVAFAPHVENCVRLLHSSLGFLSFY